MPISRLFPELSHVITCYPAIPGSKYIFRADITAKQAHKLAKKYFITGEHQHFPRKYDGSLVLRILPKKKTTSHFGQGYLFNKCTRKLGNMTEGVKKMGYLCLFNPVPPG